jgi:hypothetical protein
MGSKAAVALAASQQTTQTRTMQPPTREYVGAWGLHDSYERKLHPESEKLPDREDSSRGEVVSNV